MSLFMFSHVFSQKLDSNRITLRPKAKPVSKVPQIKATIQPYKVGNLGYHPANIGIAKSGKILNVLKIYPNPVSEQLNISLRLDKEANLSIKITDLLGNDIISLANERTAAGEYTKTYIIPDKLTSGIYFLRILAGGEPVIKRISVL